MCDLPGGFVSDAVEPKTPVVIYPRWRGGEDHSRAIEIMKNGQVKYLSVRVPGADFEGVYLVTSIDADGVWGVLMERSDHYLARTSM